MAADDPYAKKIEVPGPKVSKTGLPMKYISFWPGRREPQSFAVLFIVQFKKEQR